MFNHIKRFLTHAAAFAAAFQAGIAHDVASMKGGFKRRAKKQSGGKRSGHPYVWGKLGLSVISSAIKNDYGTILSRKERKQLAKQNGQAFKVYYN